jgi:hypothetical protein
MKAKNIFSFTVFLLLIAPLGAHAYIDPGTGSFIFQVIAAAVLGTAFNFKFFWRKIKSFSVSFKQLSKEKDGEAKKP